MRIGDEVEFNCDVQNGATFGSIGKIVAIFSGWVPSEDQAQIEFPDGSRIWARANEFALCGVETRCSEKSVEQELIASRARREHEYFLNFKQAMGLEPSPDKTQPAA